MEFQNNWQTTPSKFCWPCSHINKLLHYFLDEQTPLWNRTEAKVGIQSLPLDCGLRACPGFPTWCPCETSWVWSWILLFRPPSPHPSPRFGLLEHKGMTSQTSPNFPAHESVSSLRVSSADPGTAWKAAQEWNLWTFEMWEFTEKCNAKVRTDTNTQIWYRER